MAVLIVFGILACCGSAVVAFLLFNKKQQVVRQVSFEAEGWRFTALPYGFRVDGELDGCPWTYESIAKSKSNRGKRVWSVAAEPTEMIVVMGPPVPPAMSAMMGSGLGQMVLKMLLGDEAEDLASVHTVVYGGDFGARVSIMATEESAARALITPAVEDAMLAMDGKLPAVIRWRDRLEIMVEKKIWDAAALQKVVDLGASMVPQLGYGD